MTLKFIKSAASSLRIQPPFIRSRYFVRNARGSGSKWVAGEAAAVLAGYATKRHNETTKRHDETTKRRNEDTPCRNDESNILSKIYLHRRVCVTFGEQKNKERNGENGLNNLLFSNY